MASVSTEELREGYSVGVSSVVYLAGDSLPPKQSKNSVRGETWKSFSSKRGLRYSSVVC